MLNCRLQDQEDHERQVVWFTASPQWVHVSGLGVGTAVVGLGGGGECEETHLNPPPSLHTISPRGQRSPPTTYGVPSQRHELDMETTCICIHVSAGSVSSGQTNPLLSFFLLFASVKANYISALLVQSYSQDWFAFHISFPPFNVTPVIGSLV